MTAGPLIVSKWLAAAYAGGRDIPLTEPQQFLKSAHLVKNVLSQRLLPGKVVVSKHLPALNLGLFLLLQRLIVGKLNSVIEAAEETTRCLNPGGNLCILFAVFAFLFSVTHSITGCGVFIEH